MAIDKEYELGGLWLKTSQAGNKFMSGKLRLNGETIDVVVFKNSFKVSGDNTPDYRVYRSEPREAQTKQYERPDPSELNDDIPF